MSMPRAQHTTRSTWNMLSWPRFRQKGAPGDLIPIVRLSGTLQVKKLVTTNLVTDSHQVARRSGRQGCCRHCHHPAFICHFILFPFKVYMTYYQGLTGSRYPTRPEHFFKYPTRPDPEIENDWVLGN